MTQLYRAHTSMIALAALIPSYSQPLEAALAERVSVKRFGAIGDGASHPLSSRYATLAAAQADYPFATSLSDEIDWAAWQAALNYAVAHQASIYVPPGAYVANRTIVCDTSAAASQDTPRPSIFGSGASCTKIIFTGGDAVALWLKGPEVPGGGSVHSFSELHGLRITSNSYQLGIGLRIDNYAFMNLVGLVIGDSFADCVYQTDTLSVNFIGCIFRGGKRGWTGMRNATAADDNESNANNINFYGCTFSSLNAYGLYAYGAAGINIYGGSIENIGRPDQGGSGTRWGVKVDAAGREGSVGLNMDGTYLEDITGEADVWCDQPDGGTGGNGVAYVFKGVIFHRISSERHTNNNIRVDTGTNPFSLSVLGCGFKAAGDYTPDAGRPCIQMPTNARGWTAELNGNHFSHDVDAPVWSKSQTFTAALGSNLNVSNDATMKVPFTAVENYGNNFDNGLNGFVAPRQMRMAFSVQTAWTSALTDGDYVTLELRVNGGITRSTSAKPNGARPVALNCELNLGRGDVVTVHVFMNTPTNGSRSVYANIVNTFFTGRPA